MRNPHSRQILTAPIGIHPLEPTPPAWVSELVPIPAIGEGPARRKGNDIDIAASRDLLRARLRVRDARQMDAGALSTAVRESYMSLARCAAEAGRHPIRIWNFVPGIGDRFGALDRYMVFNRGRFEAMSKFDWTALPTSSAIGIDGDDLTIELLAAAHPGVQVENPRQISSWLYSPAYGPRPPCFARATISTIDGGRWLLIGGTASIVGEDSCHQNNVIAQLDETLANLCAVIESITPRRADPLALLDDVRVYVARADDAAEIADGVYRRMGSVPVIEMALASVCRPELLVEIEGRVRLTPRQA